MTHEHEHHHEHRHEECGLKKRLILIGITVCLLIAAVLIEKNTNLATWQLLLVYLVPYLLIGHETLHEAVEGIMEGDAFNEHFLMSVATIGAFCIGSCRARRRSFPKQSSSCFSFRWVNSSRPMLRERAARALAI